MGTEGSPAALPGRGAPLALRAKDTPQVLGIRAKCAKCAKCAKLTNPTHQNPNPPPKAAEPSGRGREVLLSLDAQATLQKGYEFEEHPGVCGAMEAAARAFMFETREEGEGEGEGEGADAPATVVTEIA
jgi:hypothetical protein